MSYMDDRDISVIEAYREAFGQPFAIKVERLGDGYDIELLPEMNLVGLHLYAHAVTRAEDEFAEIDLEEGVELTIEEDVYSLEIHDDEFGEVEAILHVGDGGSDPFELEDHRGQ